MLDMQSEFIGPLSKEQLDDIATQRMYWVGKTHAAKAGDVAAGRELLRVSALQIRTRGMLKPELIDYISEILHNAAINPADKAAAILNIEPPANPRNRSKDRQRIDSMLACWEVAAEAPIFVEPDDEINFIQQANQIEKALNGQSKTDALKIWVYDIDSSRRKRNKYEEDTFNLAAKLFNKKLEMDQQKGIRLGERPVKVTGLKSAIYREKNTNA